MLQASTIKFLKDLKKNNNKEWFDKNRKIYETAKADFLLLVENVLKELSKKDTSIAHLQAKDCVFRINRDVRFSKDKSPYKTNMGMSIAPKGKKGISAGYYFHVEPGGCFMGGGLYQPMPEDVKKVRQEIDYCFDEFSKIVSSKKFKSVYDGLSMDEGLKLSRPPKGYDENNPAIEFLKLKSFIAMTNVADKDLTDKNLTKKIVTSFEALQPMINFLNRALDH
ncbi:MAG: DUF2461 domain-containing protein [Sphingobacteriia bacterium]|nr:DUF2461 domain-containing protein [Sphingobacteriia bacterium]